MTNGNRMEEFWIFGYGSLVWRPDFPFADQRPAALDGWVRRFWQGSTDHRGMPGAPGRVVTLVEVEGDYCIGMAYQIAAADREQVFGHLDYREKGGYSLLDVVLRFADGEAAEALVYIATADNPNYLGPADMTRMAAQVSASQGPSGHNVEYVLRLAQALREMAAEDDHVFELERLVLGG